MTSVKPADASSRRSFASTDLVKVYRDARGAHAALDRVSLTVDERRTLAILGPSGAGKTTLLRVIAGIERPDSGTLRLGGEDIGAVAASRRRIALLFQDDALFPHLSVFENLAFAMRLRRTPQRRITERVQEIAEALEIDRHLRQRPARLSGGERQRASLARAILSDPLLLLLDEPLAHLDPQLRSYVRAQFTQLRAIFAGAVIHVTHDHAEALAVADELAIMIEGRIVQTGTPQAVYDSPGSIAVARFLGSPPMNVIDGDGVFLGIRPEYVRLDPAAGFRGRVISAQSSGADRLIRLATARGEITARISACEHAVVGEERGIAFDESQLRRFDRATGELITP